MEASTTAGPRVYPIAEAFARLGIRPTKGWSLIKTGELSTFLIGRYRYVDAAELQLFIAARITEARRESQEERAAKVARAVEARQRQRQAA